MTKQTVRWTLSHGLWAVPLVLCMSDDVWAATTRMPWEGPIQTIVRSLQGPVVQFGAIASIVIFGLIIAVTEGGGMLRRAIQIIFGLSIATSAASLVAQLFQFSSGALL